MKSIIRSLFAATGMASVLGSASGANAVDLADFGDFGAASFFPPSHFE